jgi:hypothetical protein
VRIHRRDHSVGHRPPGWTLVSWSAPRSIRS